MAQTILNEVQSTGVAIRESFPVVHAEAISQEYGLKFYYSAIHERVAFSTELRDAQLAAKRG